MEKFKLILKTINLKVKRVPKTIRLVFLVSFFLVILLNIISFVFRSQSEFWIMFFINGT